VGVQGRRWHNDSLLVIPAADATWNEIILCKIPHSPFISVNYSSTKGNVGSISACVLNFVMAKAVWPLLCWNWLKSVVLKRKINLVTTVWWVTLTCWVTWSVTPHIREIVAFWGDGILVKANSSSNQDKRWPHKDIGYFKWLTLKLVFDFEIKKHLPGVEAKM